MYFIQMSGFPGSGKSTLARRIAEQTGAVIVDHDISKTAVIEASEGMDIETKTLGQISYTVDWAFIDYYLSQGNDVIFDSPCLYPEMIETGLRLAKQHNARYKYVECYLNDFEVINARLQTRERMISQIPNTTEKKFHAALNASQKPADIRCLTVDSSKPIDHYLPEVLEYIRE